MSKGWMTPATMVGAGIGLGLVANAYLKRRNALSLRERVVLITGGSSGLGLALGREFARQGASLVICARESEPLEIARQQLSEMGSEVLAIPCDVTERQQVQRMIDQVINRFGRIDVLVNNAGIITVGPMQTVTLQDYEETMRIHFWGMVYTTLAVLPHMLPRKSGRIVNITSIGGKVSVPHLLPYSASKFAAVGFSEGLHAELAKEGIVVSTVVPGLMRTGSHINAYVKGQKMEEYTLFGMLATLPITSTSAEHAARRIVQATRLGESEVILTVQAQLLARFHGLFPGLTSTILSTVNRTLPSAEGTSIERSTGREEKTPLSNFLTVMGEAAANRYNQYVRQL
jgi:NAD(P)-dependent dehydrogenase (short-subunit alcohol dehydrogenase family)